MAVGNKVNLSLLLLFVCLSISCTPFTAKPVPGRDKQAVGTWSGAAAGAGAGAVTGAQLGAAAGPGAWIGAGLGGIFGLFSGLGQDAVEHDILLREDEARELRKKSWVQEVLAEHYARRLQLHPNRDIYPADWFFDSDEIRVKREGEILLEAIAEQTKSRMPWSRIVIAVYNTSSAPTNSYTEYLTTRRAEEIALRFIEAGVEARRVLSQATTTTEPILIDPEDSINRYNQAVEIIALDR